MKGKKLFVLGLCALGAISIASALKKGHISQTLSDRYPGEYIVVMKEGVKSLDLNQFHLMATEKISDSSNAYLIKMDGNSNYLDQLELLKQDPNIKYVEPNFKYHIQGFQVGPSLTQRQLEALRFKETDLNDPQYNVLWGLDNNGKNEPDKSGKPSESTGVVGADVSAVKSWEITKGSEEIVIAVIDTGVDYDHPDLKNQMFVNEAEKNGKEGVDDDNNGFVDDVYGYDFANSDADPKDGHSHGTHCAGTIAAEHNNDIGVAGVMAKARIMAIKFLSDSGSGSTADAIKSIDYATKMNVDIMSNSWGGGGYSQALEEAIQRASDKGIVFVAAAGNSTTNNDSDPHYPSNYEVPNVIAVSAHTAQDSMAYFSSYGKKTVHVAAPGHNILSSVIDEKYAVYSGTSMATPHVSGVVGLLLSKEGRLAHEDLLDRVLQTSVPVRTYKKKVKTGGRIDAYNLLTDTRPQRPVEPKPEDWVRVELDEAFESAHPYTENTNLSKVFTHEGAKHVRLVFERFEVEKKFDWLEVLVPGDKDAADRWDGSSTEEYTSEYVDGDKIELRFSSDKIVHKWGFKVIALEYVQ